MPVELNKLTLHQHLRGHKLTSTQRDVLQCLASYGDFNLTGIRVSVNRVAEDYGMNRDTVWQAIKVLKETKWLTQVRKGGGRSGRNGVGIPTEFRIGPTVPICPTVENALQSQSARQ